jgi:TonB family protein
LQDLAIDDPFLRDAIEGYVTSNEDQRSHLAELSRQLKDETKKPVSQSWSHIWRMAASIALLITTGALMYLGSKRELGTNRNRVEITFEANPDALGSNLAFDPISDTDALVKADEVRSPLESEHLSEQEGRQEKPQNSPAKQTKLAENVILSTDTDSALGRIIPESKIIANTASSIAESTQKELTPIVGRIFDDIGNPLIGANIHSLGGEHVFTSDQEGRFTIGSDDIQNGLEISYAGFQSKQIRAEAPEVLDSIILHEDHRALDEIVFNNFKKESGSEPGATARPFQSPPAKLKANAPDSPVIGWPKYLAYIEQTRKMPNAARNAGISGSVELSFIIDHQGRPQNIKILQSLGYGCDNEAIRLIQEGPSWYPKNSPTDSIRFSVIFK